MSASFRRMMVVDASTQRPPATPGGKRGTPVEYLLYLKCTPVDPVSPETKLRMGLNSPYAVWQTFVDSDVDIVAGDVMVIEGASYPVRLVADWPWAVGTADRFKVVMLEELRK